MRIVDTHTHLDGRQFEKDLAEVLDRAAAAGVRWMMCVGTDLASSRRCIELARRFPGRLRAAVGIHPNQWRDVDPGFHISFAGAVTRPGHKKTKAAARAVPEDRLLVETDCPYQTPAARSGARNEPAFIVDTIEALAALRDEEPATIASLTTANAMRLFFGDPPPAA